MIHSELFSFSSSRLPAPFRANSKRNQKCAAVNHTRQSQGLKVTSEAPKQEFTKLLFSAGRKHSGLSVPTAVVAEAPTARPAETQKNASVLTPGQQVRVRFAPSPTGNLHVGGARTALFNWLFAKNTGGKFILRVEDTDTARSTRESEEAMIRDLKWLGLDWDEGPDVGGPHAPYRQSERTAIYKEYVDKLVANGHAYPCFCTDEELEAMKKDAEEKKLPPIYRGKWATAKAEEVAAMMAAGAPYCYRFRVPPNKDIVIQDMVRGEVKWNTDTLGDFVLLRSSGLPVYNFCVAIDDALMQVTHVLRAEEHLPNTLRQVLIYQAVGITPPRFGHMSLILAPDKSKLSKRHGATSVGEFRNQGYLAPAMNNFLALLGWNDGTEKELFSVDELQSLFSLDRITKSPAVFDVIKLGWMNGQHLRLLPDEEMTPLITEALVQGGILKKADGPFAMMMAKVVKANLDLVNEAPAQVSRVLQYPLASTLASEEAQSVIQDGFREVVEAVLAAADSGELETAIKGGAAEYKKWANALGKTLKRKGKRLFMPLRIALTGNMAGMDLGEALEIVQAAASSGEVVEGQMVPLQDRLAELRAWYQKGQ